MSLMNVTDATTGTFWEPTPFTMIFPYYYRMLWEHLGNHPNSLLRWTLPTSMGGSYPEHSAGDGGVCIICYLWLAQHALSSWVNSPAWRPTGGAALW